MKRWILPLAYLAVIVLIVALADRRGTTFIFQWIRNIPGGDKVGHFCLIGGLAFVVNYGAKCREISFGTRKFLMGSLIVATVATLEEISQIWIPTRSFDLVDLLADFLGIWLVGRLARRAGRENAPAPTLNGNH